MNIFFPYINRDNEFSLNFMGKNLVRWKTNELSFLHFPSFGLILGFFFFLGEFVFVFPLLPNSTFLKHFWLTTLKDCDIQENSRLGTRHLWHHSGFQVGIGDTTNEKPHFNIFACSCFLT